MYNIIMYVCSPVEGHSPGYAAAEEAGEEELERENLWPQ